MSQERWSEGETDTTRRRRADPGWSFGRTRSGMRCQDELEEHPRRFGVAPLGGRDRDQVARRDRLGVLTLEGLDIEREIGERPSRDEKRPVPLDEEDPFAERVPHSGATSSDWQLGHMGCFPTPLNFSPQLRHL